MSTEFQVSNVMYAICWTLAGVVIVFDIFLFTTYLNELPHVWIAIILGIAYLVRFMISFAYNLEDVLHFFFDQCVLCRLSLRIWLDCRY